MKMILLNGHGIDMRVNSAKLHIKNSRTSSTEEPEEFNKWMNNKVTYKGKSMMWSYVLLLKTRELAQYLVEKRKTIDFSNPCYAVERQDSEDIRQKILGISYTEWKKRGFSRGILHYMEQNAKDDKPFTLNAHVRERVEMWDRCC